MKSIINCVKYQYRQYLLSTKFIVPTILYAGLMGFMYSIAPVYAVSIFSLMSLFLFIFMAWMSAMCQDLEPEVSEQIIILRMQSARKYYYSQVLFYAGLCGLITTLSLAYPLLSHYLHGQKLFSRSLVGMDIVGGFLLMFLCSFAGCMVGTVFSPRIVRNPKARIILIVLVVALSVTRIGIVSEHPMTRFFLWIVPPISDLISWFTKEEYFQPGRLCEACLILLLYGIVLAVVQVELSRSRKF